MMRFVKESLIHATPERVFAFHERSDALRLLTPPWERARVIQSALISAVGSRAIVEAPVLGPFKTRWVAEHTAYDPPRMFEDVQIRGPFRKWRHRHIVEPHPEGAILRDEIDYEPPLWIIGRLVAPLVIERRLRKLFAFRHEVTRRACEAKDE
jgi:ligand-binding SRPBCC domain-containing protein